MPYSSYSNYLEYKNCKRETLPCYNNFNSYKKYNRSLSCNRAWWTNEMVLSAPASARGLTINKYIMIKPCKIGENKSCDKEMTHSKGCVGLKRCFGN